MRPRILVTGANGQLGFELARQLVPCGEVVAVDRARVDLADPDSIVAILRAVEPAIVVNAAAYTAVDLAERETDLALRVNAVAPRILAEEAKRRGALLIHYSTDYVFDGRASAPYAEGDATAPLNVYGRSKLEGEQAVLASGAQALVFRTSWVYGRRGRNFLLTMQRLAAEREELRVVADQIGVPNWSRALAEATASVLSRGKPWLAEQSGLYHLSSGGATTWHAFACAILGNPVRPRIVPITTAEYPTPARRPAYAVLATAKFERTFGFALPSWQDALARCLREPPDPDSA